MESYLWTCVKGIIPLIIGIKDDFARFGKLKSDIKRSFEKFFVFQNKFVTLATLCAEMHESIIDAPLQEATLHSISSKRSTKNYYAAVRRISKRATDLYGDCLKLRLLTPIMAEAFINMIILTFAKDELLKDRGRYDEFLRQKIPQKLELLSDNCMGFGHAIDLKTPEYANFKRVMDKRNFVIHGNVDPVRDQIETVYFEGKRPLFSTGGDHILKFFDHQERLNAPEEVISDYEAVHLFLYEITTYLTPDYKFFFDQVINDPYPGYEVYKKRVTKILPNHNMVALMPGMRFDHDLNVNW